MGPELPVRKHVFLRLAEPFTTSAELSYLAVQFVERVADKPVLTGYILNMLSKPVA